MSFTKDSDSYGLFTLHVQGKTCCVILPWCHLAFKKLKKKKQKKQKVHKELFLLQACSGWVRSVMFWSHAMCVTNHWASTKKKKATSSYQSSPRQSTWKCLKIGVTTTILKLLTLQAEADINCHLTGTVQDGLSLEKTEKQENAAKCYTRSQMLLC